MNKVEMDEKCHRLAEIIPIKVSAMTNSLWEEEHNLRDLVISWGRDFDDWVASVYKKHGWAFGE